MREACYANETRVAGRICLSPCSSGTVPYGANAELCYATVPSALWPFFWTGDKTFSNWSNSGPLISKILTSRSQSDATCAPGYESLNGQCFADCPAGSMPLGPNCVADCPDTFKSVDNQSACLRPSYRRAKITSFIDNLGHIIRYILFGIAFLFIMTKFTARPKNSLI